MPNFSLSPAVTIREVNLTGNVPNIPSAKTGMVLRANSGPAMDVTAITNETDLITVFGKPTAANYQDWFQAWNFLQYASSLYIVRPIDANGATKNAGLGISGDTSTPSAHANFYNNALASHSLEQFNSTADTLYFINREATSNQRLALAISSSALTFKNQIGLEYFANVNAASGANTVTTIGNTTLAIGSQVILNGDKLATVVSVNSAASGTVLFDRPVSAVDVDAFYAVAAVSAVTTVGTNFTATFNKAGFTLKVGSLVKTDFVVTNIVTNSTDATLFDVTFINKTTPATAPTFVAGSVVSSSAVFFKGTTGFNSERNDFGINAGDSVINLQNGFILEPGIKFNLAGVADTLTVASVDVATSKITLVTPCPSAVTSGATVALSVVAPTVNKMVVGVNFLDKVYDAGLIKKTRKSVTKADGSTVSIIAQSLVPFSSFFDYAPNWSNNEFAIVVLRINDDEFYEKFETFTVSYNVNAKNNAGNNIFVENVINKGSKAVYVKLGNATGLPAETSNTSIQKIVGDATTIYPTKQAYGKTVYDAFGYTKGDIDQAFTLFADPESFDINILQCHELDINYASGIAEDRKDLIAVVAPYDYASLATASANDCTAYLLDNFGSQTEFDGKLFSGFGTYSAIYGNMKYQYDKYNNVNRWINVAGDIAGLYAQTDRTNDPWWAVAGTARGVIKNAIKLAFNPNKQNRDELYVNSINPIMAIPGEGNAVVWGQKTATATPSAMDRVNVRRLLIHLEKSIATATSIGLFEFNDAFTRSRLFNIIDPFLRSVTSRRGLFAYKIIVDETNNTNDVIDQNGLVIDIYLQPTKVAEFIRVTAAVVPTGATFAEFVGSF
jgi:phage tail sheath protein FI